MWLSKNNQFCTSFAHSAKITRSRYCTISFLVGIIFGSGVTQFFLHWYSYGVSVYSSTPTTLSPSEAKRLPRVLCLIPTGPANHFTRTIHVKNTWGIRCDKLLFMSSVADKRLGTIALPNIKEGRYYLWDKVQGAFRYAYHYHYEDADWFFKADDDTFVIMENLRFLLSGFDSSKSIYFGSRIRRMNKMFNETYMQGGAGYVLSKAALSKFINHGDACIERDSSAEDVRMSQCLEIIGVEAGDARDRFGRNLFLPDLPEVHLFPGNTKRHRFYSKYSYYPQGIGPNCCSDQGISFHKISPAQMYALDYLIYRLKPHMMTNDEVKVHKLK